MYDTLLRRDPRDGQTIIPDLAWKWEIAPDGKKYTFHLRKGVKFHDGADFTAEDVKATFDRIARPPKGVVIPRTPLFATVGAIVIVDPHKIEFRLTEARPQSFMLGAFASGWNVIVRKKTLEENQGNLRQVMNYPGTGPYRHASRKDKEVWIQERNPNYWNKGLPYLDKLEIYHMMPFSAELGASFISGKLDYGRLLDPVSWRKAKEMPGVTAAAFNQSVIQAFWMNQKKKPFQDVRVRRAIHLAMDRPTLVEVVKDTAPMQIGGFVYPFHDASTPRSELEKRLGYQKDVKPAIQEARKLMQEAGYGQGIKGLDFVVREANSFKLWAVAIQAMLKEHLNIECNLRVVQISQWFDEVAPAPTWPSALCLHADGPPDYFTAWYGRTARRTTRGGRMNSSTPRPANRPRTGREQAQALIRQAELILEQTPLIPWLRADRCWYNRVQPRTVEMLRHLRCGPLGSGLLAQG